MDDFKKINLMKKRLDERLTQLREDPYNKVSLRGQTGREKHKDLRATREGYQLLVDNYDTFQELLDNAATYGPNSAKALNTLLKRDIFTSPDRTRVAVQQNDAAQLNSKRGGAQAASRVNLTETEPAYQICLKSLQRRLQLIDFLDEDLRRAAAVPSLPAASGTKGVAAGAKEGDLGAHGAGNLSEIESLGAGDDQTIKQLTQGLHMTLELNMMSSDSEGEQEATTYAP